VPSASKCGTNSLSAMVASLAGKPSPSSVRARSAPARAASSDGMSSGSTTSEPRAASQIIDHIDVMPWAPHASTYVERRTKTYRPSDPTSSALCWKSYAPSPSAGGSTMTCSVEVASRTSVARVAAPARRRSPAPCLLVVVPFAQLGSMMADAVLERGP